ncbi:superoxide dismutase domain protein [Mycobacterium xenopi 4042]|uniref:Superoxide dismutase domain protein n=1 Tax=Mycobacterium xenopi 4042 TaxID=1299334 RepID=X8ARI3_MYCXE|nr:superoxide dismutase domain protein [Mycobacterium xenopi 4042]
MRKDGAALLVTTSDAFTKDDLLAGNKTALVLHGAEHSRTPKSGWRAGDRRRISLAGPTAPRFSDGYGASMRSNRPSV